MWTMSRPTVVTAAYEAPSTPRASRHKPHVEGSYAKAAEQFQRPRAGTVRAKAQAAAEFVRAGNGCVVDALAKFGIAKQRFSEVAPMQRPAEPTEETRSMMIDGVMYEYQHKIGPCRSVAEDKTVKENRAKFNWREKQKAFKRAAAAAATAAAEFDGVEAAELRRCADEGYDHEEDGEDPVRADLLALNARHPKIKAPKEHTLTQRIISNARTVAGRLISSMRLRSVGHALEGNEALPHDASALDEHTLSLIINEQTGEETKAVCVDCAHETSFSVEASRAYAFDSNTPLGVSLVANSQRQNRKDGKKGFTSMFGKNLFFEHPHCKQMTFAEQILEEQYEEIGWRPKFYIRCCTRCHFTHAATGSEARSDAAASRIWAVCDLNKAAARLASNALELPYIEPAPMLEIPKDEIGGVEFRRGKDMTFVCFNKDDLVETCKDLNGLCGKKLKQDLIEEYAPYVLDEAAVRRLVERAVAYGKGPPLSNSEGTARINRGGVAIAALQMEPDIFARAKSAAASLLTSSSSQHASSDETAALEELQGCLRDSAASHLLLPHAYFIDEPTERTAAEAVAASFRRSDVSAANIASQYFCREGGAGGPIDKDTAEELLSHQYDVLNLAPKEWGQEMSFIAPTHIEDGFQFAALSYMADENGRSRKSKGKSLRRDGVNQASRRLPPFLQLAFFTCKVDSLICSLVFSR